MGAENLTRCQSLADGEITELVEPRDLLPAWHRWSQREIDAVTLALAAQRPLLLRGEPGSGKTQLARAAANHLGWKLHTVVIHARYETSDLFYRFDAVRRLADAQAAKSRDDLPPETDYLKPGPLWQVLDWPKAADMLGSKENPAGHVLLLDEIDKADTDLANSLLDALGSRRFHHPYSDAAIGGEAGEYPLVVITTNEDREMPAAFLRRCIVLDMDVLAAADYRAHLHKVADAHFAGGPKRPRRLHDDVIKAAVARVVADRLAIADLQLSPPGVAELIDLLNALEAMQPGSDADTVAVQREWLERLGDYALRKHQGSELPPDLRQGQSQDRGQAPDGDDD